MATRWSFLALLFFATGCSKITPAMQRESGRATYQAYCESCHDTEQGVGPRLTRRLLVSRGTAARLFVYNRDKMPYNAGNTLTEAEYWNVTAYVLARSDLLISDIVLDDKNARHIILSSHHPVQ